MQIKEWILNNLYSNNKLISKRCRLEWFHNNRYTSRYDEIVMKTNFLMDESVTLGQRIWHIINKKYEMPKCLNPECNNNTSFICLSIGYLNTCCNRCAQKNPTTISKIKSTNLKKYGTEYGLQSEYVKQAGKSTLLDKYGVDNISKADGISNKKKETCRKNHGVDWIVQNRKFIEDIVFDRYGVKNVQQIKSIADKRVTTRRKIFYNSLFTGDRLKLLATPLFTEEEYITSGLFKKYNFKCNVCNTIFEDCLEDGDLPRCTECYKGSSIFEKEVGDFIKTFISPSDIIENDKKILGGLELDLYIPSKNIAIECDGLFWHGEIGGGKTKTYHITKTNKCEVKNIRLIHIFEDEWVNNKELVKSKLKHILGSNVSARIHARKCIIKEISDNSYVDFVNKHHIQGAEKTSCIRLGAYYNDILVAVSTFGKLRKCLGQISKDREYELYRFCIDTSYIISGIGGKLMSHFIQTYNPLKITSYADRRWTSTSKNIYSKLGFKLVSNTVPNYWYFGKRKNYKRYHRFNFRKDQLSATLPIFDPSLSEWENMKNNKWDRIWDCGNIKYELIIS